MNVNLWHGVTAPLGRPARPPNGPSKFARRLGVSAAAFVVADLLLGFILFSLSVLVILWYFAFGWIHLHEEYAAAGLSFGSVAQFQAATALVFVIPLLIGLVCFLAVSAAPLPPALWRTARSRGSLRSALVGLHRRAGR
jgi:hypothetical protein